MTVTESRKRRALRRCTYATWTQYGPIHRLYGGLERITVCGEPVPIGASRTLSLPDGRPECGNCRRRKPNLAAALEVSAGC